MMSPGHFAPSSVLQLTSFTNTGHAGGAAAQLLFTVIYLGVPQAGAASSTLIM